MQALALGLIVTSIVLVRGGLKGLNPADSFRDIFSRIPTLNVPPPTATVAGNVRQGGGTINRPFPPNVERWRSLVAANFPANRVEEALAIIQCESMGNPSARNPQSGASGLFQHLPKYWQGRSAAAGLRGANIMDPTANVKVAAWLFRSRPIPWQDWECKEIVGV